MTTIEFALKNKKQDLFLATGFNPLIVGEYLCFNYTDRAVKFDLYSSLLILCMNTSWEPIVDTEENKIIVRSKQFLYDK